MSAATPGSVSIKLRHGRPTIISFMKVLEIIKGAALHRGCIFPPGVADSQMSAGHMHCSHASLLLLC